MNDRFKFRTYHIPTKTMEYNGQWSGKDYDKKFNDCNFIVMQCTGLKDKNCKLIYENDIIRFYFDNDEIIAVIKWDNDECRFYLNTTDFFKDKYVTDYEIVKQEEYEVIGNIYENKELLEDTECQK